LGRVMKREEPAGAARVGRVREAGWAH
jgi:hypothetical protein